MEGASAEHMSSQRQVEARREPGSTDEGGSRRQVTVLFCDLVGSTEMAEHLDPEVVREILLAYQRGVARVVDRYDGYIGKFMGDGVLVYFGYPRAHEDDPRRAVLAGLDLIDEVAGLGRAVSAAHGVEVAVRVGIHTGLVVIAEMGAGERRQQHDVVGASTNLAYRIQAEAEPNTVFVSAATYDLVRGYFIVSPVGARRLRGISHPVEIYQVLRASGAESRLEAVRRRTPLVGRQAECTALREAWSRVCAGGAEAILVEGEPGIGKSRLVETLTEEVRRCQGVLVTLQCSPYHVNTQLFPVARLLRRLVQPDDDVAASWSRLRAVVEAAAPASTDDLCLLASFADIALPDGFEVPELTAERRREQLIGALLAWVDRTSASAPALLVVEDLHWADPSTLEVLERLATRLVTRRLLLVFTSRPGHGYRSEITTLRLEPLDRDAREELVSLLSGDETIVPSLRTLIVERSDGVPLYIEELSRMLAGVEEGGEIPRGTLPTLAIPMSLHDLLTARLDQFPDQKHLAQVAATAGPGALLALLAVLVSKDEKETAAALEPLVAGGILQIDGTTCSFRHALLRDAAYQSQLRSSRRDLHRRIAAALCDHFPTIADTQPELLAEHYLEGGDCLRAAECWYRAGQRMAYQGAHTEASAHYRRALAALTALPADEEAAHLELALEESLGVSVIALEGYTSPTAEQAYARAMELAARVERRPDAATHWGLWAYCVVRGDHPRATALARESLAAAHASGRRAEVLHASSLLGYSESYVGHFQAARELLEAGAEYDFAPEEIEIPHHPAVASLVNLAPTLWILGRPDDGRRALARALELAETLGRPWGPFTRAFAHTYGAWFSELAADPAAAANHATRAVEIAGEHGFPTWLGAGTVHLGIAQGMSGAPAQSVYMIESAIDMWRAAGAELFVTYFLFGLADARRRAGDARGARRVVDEALACVEERDERFYEAELLRLRGELRVEGSPSGAEQDVSDLWRAIEVARRQEAATFELRAVTSLHRAARQAPDGGETSALLEATLSGFPTGESMPEVDDALAALAAVPA